MEQNHFKIFLSVSQRIYFFSSLLSGEAISPSIIKIPVPLIMGLKSSLLLHAFEVISKNYRKNDLNIEYLTNAKVSFT